MTAADAERWDEVVRELIEVVGALARLSAAATGEAAIVEQIQEGAQHVARAASMALPRSTLGRETTP